MSVDTTPLTERCRTVCTNVALLPATAAHPFHSWVVKHHMVSTYAHIVGYWIVFLHSDLDISYTGEYGWLPFEGAVSYFGDAVVWCECSDQDFSGNTGGKKQAGHAGGSRANGSQRSKLIAKMDTLYLDQGGDGSTGVDDHLLVFCAHVLYTADFLDGDDAGHTVNDVLGIAAR